jgi:hypothetical protein
MYNSILDIKVRFKLLPFICSAMTREDHYYMGVSWVPVLKEVEETAMNNNKRKASFCC